MTYEDQVEELNGRKYKVSHDPPMSLARALDTLGLSRDHYTSCGIYNQGLFTTLKAPEDQVCTCGHIEAWAVLCTSPAGEAFLAKVDRARGHEGLVDYGFDYGPMEVRRMAHIVRGPNRDAWVLTVRVGKREVQVYATGSKRVLRVYRALPGGDNVELLPKEST